MDTTKKLRRAFNFIYFGLTLLSSHCIGYIAVGSFKGRGNLYIIVGQDSKL